MVRLWKHLFEKFCSQCGKYSIGEYEGVRIPYTVYGIVNDIIKKKVKVNSVQLEVIYQSRWIMVYIWRTVVSMLQVYLYVCPYIHK